MEPTRFDAVARALASGVSRRQLVKAALASVIAGMRPAWRWTDTAGQTTACAAGEILCAERCVKRLTDTRNCGVCGELCAPGRQCVDGLCQPPVELSDGCRSEHLRLWFGAFIPWVEGGISTFEIVNGEERSLLRVPVPGSDPLIPEALLAANRQARTTFDSFSHEIDARSLAHHEITVTLPTMEVSETAKPNRAIAQISWVSGGPDPGYRQICERALAGPSGIGGLSWLSIEPVGERVVQFLIDAVWEVARGGNESGCVLDEITFGPIRLKGVLRVERDDANRLVEVSFVEDVIRNSGATMPGQVGLFPAFELYASLDDGNLVPVFRYAPEDTWTAHDQDELLRVPPEPFNLCEDSAPCPAGVARLLCGCSPCRPGGGEDCTVQTATEPCQEIPSYFVLSGSSAFDPAINVICADPACPIEDACSDVCKTLHIDADGLVEVFVGTSATPVYRSDPTARGKLPPIGLRAFRDDEIRVTAIDTATSRDGLRNLKLHRVDGANGPVVVQQAAGVENEVTVRADGRVETTFEITLGPSLRGVPICCPDAADQVCVDRTTSQRHCGGCNRQCPVDQLCLSGECVCPHPFVWHNNSCVDPTQDATACGPNLLDCTAAGMVCARSTCLPSGCTDVGQHVCNDTCFALTDPEHCGPACVACQVPTNGEAHCGDGRTCTITCNDGFHTCDDVTCSDSTSAATCGQSCTPCPAPANATALCSETGTCYWECNPGFTSCDGVSCFDITSPLSCGFSCTACPEWAPNCLSGSCCPPGTTFVCDDGSCVIDFMTDDRNCGGCGNSCPIDVCCESGSCMGTAKVDIEHCLGCHQGCAFPNDVCSNGECSVSPPDPPPPCPCGFIGDECLPGPCEA